ncbi:glycosyltransferase [Vibrio vulnificus]|uniref:glycosyltransferase n=1 Tax=Vibrio vulnificus TaxID=672 RepID=UPI0002D3CD1D|nr:glycosyltransferase [Vibrio vulnificus]EGQ7950907.1 glycosyltransferase [Vibrio vulnificus]EGQ7984134.1 glycosyltransferase [Vibrio vulnificus]MCU8149072.1 glycosyltransferase [Vibrio vulnificus]RZR38728.1 glycosyltransferase [Vibrio vulnificus]HAS8110982.1 glycosyltransferase [Vibrio vulnificus]
MNIGIFLSNAQYGGIPQVAYNYVVALTEMGHTVTVILQNGGLKINKNYECEIIELTNYRKSFYSKVFAVFDKLIKLNNLKKIKNFDMCISLGDTSNIYNILTRKYSRVIITEHNIKSIENGNSNLVGYLKNLSIKKLYPRADKVVALTNVMKLDLEQCFGIRNVDVIPNPHLLNYLKSRSEANIPDSIGDKDYFVFVGNMTRRKGLIHVLKSFSKFIKDNKRNDINLVILGPFGEFEKYIRKSIDLNELQDYVKILGSVDNPYPYIKNAKALLMGSFYEGLPNVIVESMALGTPVVSTDCVSGPSELLVKTDVGNNYKFVVARNGLLCPVFPDINDSDPLQLQQEHLIYSYALNYIVNDEVNQLISKNAIASSKIYDHTRIMESIIR